MRVLARLRRSAGDAGPADLAGRVLRRLRLRHSLPRTDSAGNRTATLAYDEYGNPGSSNTGLFQYTGQIALYDTGLYHYKNRAYHPGLGIFMQTDPIGQTGGINLYAYVGGDPVNFTDPWGLSKTCTGSRIKRPDNYNCSRTGASCTGDCRGFYGNPRSGYVTITDYGVGRPREGRAGSSGRGLVGVVCIVPGGECSYTYAISFQSASNGLLPDPHPSLVILGVSYVSFDDLAWQEIRDKHTVGGARNHGKSTFFDAVARNDRLFSAFLMAGLSQGVLHTQLQYNGNLRVWVGFGMDIGYVSMNPGSANTRFARIILEPLTAGQYRVYNAFPDFLPSGDM
ncbi:RHS repeat-associated core domain-containing protein [Marinicauda algicola]|uniref:RHS repeat-associated core domain-containing protein n=1 Tax=Marinicauda algicola TaxID=2029849 RepID=A0A4S2H0C8_9PROT|nr:RHS repeat-associated core domain-containing protein [Marinicauda algicola]TGY88631.1 RHS repeat-associated core domain-containing protein [Marinicauda algicola]